MHSIDSKTAEKQISLCPVCNQQLIAKSGYVDDEPESIDPGTHK